MFLDLSTIAFVSLTATTILGLLLCFTWWRERSGTLIGWWGVAQLLMAAGIAFAGAAADAGIAPLTVFGQSLMLLAAAVMWMAVREFEGRKLDPVWVALWPCAFVIAAVTGIAISFDQRLILVSTSLGILHLLAAGELTSKDSEPLISRWPAIVLLVLVGLSYLAWMPLTLTMPIHAVGLAYSSAWMPTVVLIALLGRIALAFVVLALVKERQEVQQRTFALTDALTGLPNRRALFEAADALAERGRQRRGRPISVLVLDLDHFKKINDTYGHRLGDRVLQLFSSILSDTLDTGSIVGRLGGEEFAAILPGADLNTATAKAESVRAAFAEVATVIDGHPVAGTVSIGVASHDDMDCDIGALFHRADGALYAAKQTGRNRIEVVGPAEASSFEDASIEGHALASRWLSERKLPIPQTHATRRFRGSADAA